MRIYFAEIERVKLTAKLLSRLSPAVTLANVLENLARASGYRDWHELDASFGGVTNTPTEFSPEIAAHLVLELAAALNLECGDVQFAISKARLLGSSRWSTSDQITVYMSALRSGFLGAPARGQPGTIVKVKGLEGPGYILRTDHYGVVHLLKDGGTSGCVPEETVTPRTPIADFLPARLWLPYGVWTLNGGSEVVFARDYHPLWHISAEGVERLDPWLWIRGIKSERWFAHNTEGDWWRPQGRVPALAYLEGHRISELPKLGNAMLDMFAPGVESISGAVRRMHNRAQDLALPRFAMLNTNLLRD